MTKSTAFYTDFYELSMLAAAIQSGAGQRRGVFELFARKLPDGRRYGVVGGTLRAVQAVLDFRFTTEQLNYLAQDPVFTQETIDYLRDYKFSGNLHGYMEGDLYFPYSPIITVEGTFADSVIVETVLLSIMNYDSAVASAASRMVQAAASRFPLIEMGSRRTHEMAAVSAARVAYIAGFDATSNLEAGLRYGIPTTGTAAHAFTLAHDTEEEAFAAQVKTLGVGTTLLVDTYNIEQGIRTAVNVAGPELGAIRIDSGDLHDEPNNARKLLDELGATKTRIVVSSDIDEYSIAEIVERGTPVDGVGAGTRVVTGSGAPTAGMVFKLVEKVNGSGDTVPVAKKSASKASVGGFKRVYRTMENGKITGEFYSASKDALPPATTVPVQRTFIRDGELVYLPTVEMARTFHAQTMATLPTEAKLTVAGEAFLTAQLGDDNK